MNLITLAKNGNAAAKHELFVKTVKKCRYIIGTLLQNNAAADRVCADIFERVFSSFERIDDNEDFVSWMKNAAAIAACSVKRKTEPKAFLNDDYTDDDDGSDDILLNDEQLAEDLQGGRQDAAFVVERCIEKASVATRAAIICLFYNGNTIPQFAKVAGVSEERASELAERARAALGLVYNESKEEINDGNLCEIIDSIAAKTAVPQNISVTALCGALPKEKAQEKESADNRSDIVKVPVNVDTRSTGRKPILFICALIAIGLLTGAVFFKGGFSKEPAVKSSSSAAVSSAASRAESSKSSSADVNQSSVSSKQESAQSKASDISSVTSSKAVFAKRFASKLPYAVTSQTVNDKNGNFLRSETFSYKNGVLSSAQTKTQVLSETLYYSYSQNGSTRTTKDGSGTITEKTEYDKNGCPVKLTFKDGKTLKYRWSYSYNREGMIESAAYKSNVSGKYNITYDNAYRITTVSHTRDGKTESESFAYDENGMLLKHTVRDFAGIKTDYNYNYNSENHTFSCKASNGNVINGTYKDVEGGVDLRFSGVLQ